MCAELLLLYVAACWFVCVCVSICGVFVVLCALRCAVLLLSAVLRILFPVLSFDKAFLVGSERCVRFLCETGTRNQQFYAEQEAEEKECGAAACRYSSTLQHGAKELRTRT